MEKSKTQLLTVVEAASRLRLKPSTIRAWILQRKHLEVIRLGRAVRITSDSVESLIERNKFLPKEGR